MAYPINSEEFAQAWRIVSESLLATLQNIGSNGMERSKATICNDIGITQDDNPKKATSVEESANRIIEDVVYANCPISDGDGGYVFKNLKEEKSEQSTFKITRFSDGTAEFSIIEELSNEALQNLKDNIGNRLPALVGTSEGTISEGCRIVNEIKGRGRKEGRSVKITEPLRVIFK